MSNILVGTSLCVGHNLLPFIGIGLTYVIHTGSWLYCRILNITMRHELRTPGEEIAFTARQKINSQSQIFRYGRNIFNLPHRPKFSDFFDLCLHLVSVVRAMSYGANSQNSEHTKKSFAIGGKNKILWQVFGFCKD